ncbi:hypothetical protein DYB32_001695 [Aphanomyces invadans]|uniref:Uncharacterized protein n=1 Tax=Aphanomyces invadans TaxID=157072 RepID=A0A3R7ADQ8_9STRA|nr:hypothetical protein DYB32_001695 [Aphanomyces invadans]
MGGCPSTMDKKGQTLGNPRPTPIAPLGDDLGGRRSSLKLKIKKKHVDITPSTASFHQTPIAPSTPSVVGPGNSRKLPLAPAPSMVNASQVVDDDDDESGDDGEDTTVSATNGAALRGGRWTSEEHERFLSGFRLHGHKWKRVQMVVRSRTVTQVRTHAQKYLLKLQKISGEPRSSSDITYMQSFGQGMNNGATSPTQSVQGHGTHDDVEGRATGQHPSTSSSQLPPPHQLLSSLSRSRTLAELGQHQDGSQPYPVSPDVLLPTEEYANLSPSSKPHLKRQHSHQSSSPSMSILGRKTSGKPPMKRVKKSSKSDAGFIEEAAYALCRLMAQQIDDLEITDVEENEDDGSMDDDGAGSDDSSDDLSARQSALEKAAAVVQPSQSRRSVATATKKQEASKKRYLCRKCRVPKKGHVCDAVGSQDDDDDPASAASKEPAASNGDKVDWRQLNEGIDQGGDNHVLHIAYSSARTSSPQPYTWLDKQTDQTSPFHAAHEDGTDTSALCSSQDANI